MLGRRGVLVLDAVASMNQLGEIEKQTPQILSMVEFQRRQPICRFRSQGGQGGHLRHCGAGRRRDCRQAWFLQIDLGVPARREKIHCHCLRGGGGMAPENIRQTQERRPDGLKDLFLHPKDKKESYGKNNNRDHHGHRRTVRKPRLVGTNSGAALAGLGGVLIVWGIVKMVRQKQSSGNNQT